MQSGVCSCCRVVRRDHLQHGRSVGDDSGFESVQSAKRMVMEVVKALISIKYCSFICNGSSCIVSRFVPIMVLYSSTWMISQ